MSINYQEHWKNHEIVTDKMVMEFKEKAEIKPFESLMTVPEDNHFKAFISLISYQYILNSI